MSWIRTGLVLAALGGVALSPGAARAQVSPFVGTWHLDAAHSTRPAGETPPAELSTDITRVDPMHVHWSTTTTDAHGQKDVETFDTPGNGEFYSLDGSTMVAQRLAPDSLQSTYRDADGQTDAVTCTLSDDARSMTCAGVITHQDGSVARYTDVFNRV